MGVSLSVSAGIIGISFVIILQAFSASIPPRLSELGNAYDDMKNRSAEQCQTDLSIINITDAGWWDKDWNYRKMIIIDHTKIQSDETDFPVLIYRESDDDLAAHAQTDGDDIFFTDDNNSTKLSHEIENYSSIDGKLIVWVKIPSIYANKDTVLFMYYGNASCSSQESISNTWESNFKMVQHLKESSGTLYDSTSNNNDGTNNGAAYNTTSKIDGGYDFSLMDHINCNSSASLNITDQITLEGWVKDPPTYGDKKLFLNYDENHTIFENSHTNLKKNNLDITWNHILEHANWVLEGYTNDRWQKMDGLIINYVNLTDDTKKFSLDFIAKIMPKADYRLILTIDFPLEDYSYDNDSKTFSLKFNINNRTFSFDYDYSDISRLSDLSFDYGVDNSNRFWFRIYKKDVTFDSYVHLDPKYGLITDATISSWEYDQQEGRQPDAMRLGNSEYYLIVECGDAAADYDGWLRTIRVDNDDGSIQNSLVDSWEYDGSDGYGPSICHVSDDVYAVSYYDAGASLVKVFTVDVDDADGDITTPAIDTQSLTNNGITTSRTKIINVVDDIYAIVYSANDNDGWMETLEISNDGTITNAILDTEEFDAADGLYPTIVSVDSDTVAIVYETTDSAADGLDGMIITYNISNAGIITDTPADSWEYDTTRGTNPDIYKIYGNVYAIASERSGADGWISTHTITTEGAITKSNIDTLEFDTGDGGYQTIFQIEGSVNVLGKVFGVSYSGGGNDGFIATMYMDNNGNIKPDTSGYIDRIEFDIANNLWYAPVIWVNKSYYLVVYEGTGNDGWTTVVEIKTNYEAPKITDPIPSNDSTNVSIKPQLSFNVSDINGDSLEITWQTNESGSWETFATNWTGLKKSVVSSYEFEGTQGRFPSSVRLGTSNYYLIAAAADGGTDGWLFTIEAWNNNGSIRQSLIDSYQYDASDGAYPSLCHVSNDFYAIAYRDTGSDRVKVVTVSVNDTNGDIDAATGIIDTLSLTYDGVDCNLIRVNEKIYATAYREAGTGGVAASNDGFIETLYINANGIIGNSVNDTAEFNGTDGYYPHLVMIDSDTIAITYQGTGTDGYICTYDISSTGDIPGEPDIKDGEWEFDITYGGTPNNYKISNNIFAIVHRDSTGDGQLKTCTISDAGVITKSWIDTYEFDIADCYYPTIINAVGDLYAITYQGSDGDGFVCIINISDAGDIQNDFERLEFDTTNNLYYAPIVSMGNSYYLIVYEGFDNDGWSCTVGIKDINDTLYQINNNFNTPLTKYYWRVFVDDSIHNISATFHFTTEQPNKEILSKGQNAYSLEISPNGTSLHGYINDENVNITIDTNWHYVTLTYDGSQIIIYKDGKLEKNKSCSGNINTNTNNLMIGRYLTGTLDELRISSIARSTSWINTTYKMTSSPASFIRVEPEQNQQYTYLKIEIKNTGSTNIKTYDSSTLINGTEKPFVKIQSYIYPLKTTSIFVNVSASGSKRNKFITGNGITKYEGYG